MKQEHAMTPGVLVSGDDMSAGDYKARCSVLEAELAELRKRVCVPEGWRVVPVEPTEAMLQAADAADREYTDRSFGSGHPLVQQGPYDHWCAMLAAAPAPVERVAVWVEKLPVPTNGACAQLARIDAALARQGKDNN